MRTSITETPARLGLAVLATALAAALAWTVLVPHIQPASAASSSNVKILAKKQLKQNGHPTGNRKFLLKTGAISHRAICTDLGGGRHKVNVQIKSLKNGGKLLWRDGFIKLTTDWQFVWFADFIGQGGASEGYDILYRDGSFRHFRIDMFVNGLGADCVTRIVATNA